MIGLASAAIFAGIPVHFGSFCALHRHESVIVTAIQLVATLNDNNHP
jgi:hypothetical protein